MTFMEHLQHWARVKNIFGLGPVSQFFDCYSNVLWNEIAFVWGRCDAYSMELTNLFLAWKGLTNEGVARWPGNTEVTQ